MKANLVWAQFVNSTSNNGRIPYQDAWEVCRREKPALHTLMLALGASGADVAAHNAKRGCSGGAEARIEARNQFANEVQGYQQKFQVDYDTAYTACTRRNPALFQAMSRPTFANAEANAAGNGSIATDTENSGNVTGAYIPTANLGTNGKLNLPATTPQDIFQIAYIANGRQLTTVHPGKIMDALVRHFMQAKNMSHDGALEYVKTAFPDAWVAVQQLAKQDAVRAVTF